MWDHHKNNRVCDEEHERQSLRRVYIHDKVLLGSENNLHLGVQIRGVRQQLVQSYVQMETDLFLS